MKTLTNLLRFGRRNLFATACGLLLCVIVAVLTVSGQKTKDKPDQNLKSMARVNPSTLAMEFSLPIFSYPGRGGNGLPLVLNYSSKVWTMERGGYRTDANPVTTPSPHTEVQFTNNLLAKFSFQKVGGWTSSLRPPILLENIDLYNQYGYDFAPSSDTGGTQRVEEEEVCDISETFIVQEPACESGWANRVTLSCCDRNGPHPCQAPRYEDTFECLDLPVNPSGPGAGAPTSINTRDPQFQKMVMRARILMPDGSTHEFRKSDRILSCLPEYLGGPSDDCTDTDGTYISVDGSGMRLERGELQEDDETRDVLYLPDGGRFVFSPTGNPTSTTYERMAEKFVDADGNKMAYDIENHNWTDTMGREIVDPLQTSLAIASMGDGQEVEVPGLVGGSPSTYELVWKKLKPESCEDDDQNCTGNILEDLDANGTPNYELSYIGDDECQGIGETPISPALFDSDEPVVEWGVNQYSNNLYKNIQRVCSTFTGTSRRFNPLVLGGVNLPNGTSYEFKYNRYGEITRINYPTGGYERFRYDKIPVLDAVTPNPAYEQANRGVKEHWISFDGTTVAQHWQYESLGEVIVTTAPDGTKTRSKLFTSGVESRFGLGDPRVGMPIEEGVYSSNCTATGDPVTACEDDLMRRTLTEWIVASPRTDGDTRATRDPRVARTISIIFEPGSGGALATMTENIYDDSETDEVYFPHLNVAETKRYNYVALSLSTAQSGSWSAVSGSFASAVPVQRTEVDYLYNGDYQVRNLHSLPTETRTFGRRPSDGVEYLAAVAQVDYDESTPVSYGITPSTWEDPDGAKRGLVTTSKACSAISSTSCTAWVETRTQYDQFGNPAYQWDANQIAANHTGTQYATHTEYTDSTHDYKYAFPFRVTTPAPDPSGTTGSNTGFVTTSTYDLNTGLVLTTTDANGQTTTMEYDDPLLRPTKVIPPGGKAQIVTEYCDGQDTSPCSDAIYVRTKTQVDASHWAVATKYFDTAGRPVRVEQQDSGGNIRVDTQYDSLGRAWKTSNPYRTGGTPIWTVNGYDELGRVTTVTTPDSAVVSTAFGLNTVNTSGIPLGTLTLVTDQAGIKRLALTDAGGNLTDVWEIKSSDSDTASVGFNGTTLAGYRTRYVYDVLGKLHKVQQGSQQRYFAYDSLGRLVRAKNVEQETNTSLPSLTDPIGENSAWAQGYTYDANGNLLVTTTARNSTITNTYDVLNRVTKRDYSGSMPDVEFRYDAVTHGLGKLASVSNGLVTTRFTEYSAVGELLQSQQEFDGIAAPYTFHYSYNMAGQMVSETYPSGRVVQNNFDTEGKLNAVSSRAAVNKPFRPFAQNFAYNEHGSVNQMQLGNTAWESTQFNNRLQPTEIALGTAPGGTQLLRLNYSYGTTANNGNVLSQAITVPTIGSATGFVATQAYTYDSLNRLATAAETQYGQSTPDWRQQFGYDRFGNRSMGTGSTQTFGRNSTETQALIGPDPAVSTSTNRITNRTGELYEFDASGNMTKDALGNRSVYDIENHQTEYYYSTNTGSTPDAKYYYDGDGKRIKKVVGTETIVFVYDAAGKLAAEYTLGVTANPNPQSNYITADTLGSTRLVTNGAGQVVARHDYLPFGDEINGLGGRTSSQGFAQPDSTRQRFTGYEKDPESGLDFAEGRYYSNALGRFTGVDPVEITFEDELPVFIAFAGTPQNWNKYGYVRNNPLNLVDADGREPNKAQAGTAQQIVAIIQEIERKNPNVSRKELLQKVDDYFQNQGGGEKNKRYVYTKQGGWMDFKHFFAAANFAANSVSGRYGVQVLGFGVEVMQTLQRDESGFSYEDLGSNNQGANFGAGSFDPNGSVLSDQVSNYLNNTLQATAPEQAPNWAEMPNGEVFLYKGSGVNSRSSQASDSRTQSVGSARGTSDRGWGGPFGSPARSGDRTVQGSRARSAGGNGRNPPRSAHPRSRRRPRNSRG